MSETKTGIQPMLVATNETFRRDYREAWDAVKARVQAIVDNYHTLGFPALVDTKEMHMLFKDTDELMYQKMTGGGVSVVSKMGGNVGVNRKAALEIMEKPAGYHELRTAIEQHNKKTWDGYQNSIGSEQRARYEGAAFTRLFCFEGGKVVFSAAQQAKYDDAGRVWLKTEKEQRLYRLLKMVGEELKDRALLNALGLTHHTENEKGLCRMTPFSQALDRLAAGFDTVTGEPRLHLRYLTDGVYVSFAGD